MTVEVRDTARFVGRNGDLWCTWMWLKLTRPYCLVHVLSGSSSHALTAYRLSVPRWNAGCLGGVLVLHLYFGLFAKIKCLGGVPSA